MLNITQIQRQVSSAWIGSWPIRPDPNWILQRLKISCFIPFLQVLTRDSVTISVDAVVYYRVSNATVSVANVENAHHSTRLLAQTTLRNILGTKSLHEILSDRESISGSMQVIIRPLTPYSYYIPTKPEAILLPDRLGRRHHCLGYQGRTSWNVSSVALILKILKLRFIVSIISLQQRCPFACSASKGHGCRGRSGARG